MPAEPGPGVESRAGSGQLLADRLAAWVGFGADLEQQQQQRREASEGHQVSSADGVTEAAAAATAAGGGGGGGGGGGAEAPLSTKPAVREAVDVGTGAIVVEGGEAGEGVEDFTNVV